jgi:4-hydroxybenzoyl-CoA reductase subunit beta
MRLPSFELLQPRSVAEAVEYLAQHGVSAKVVAGGTDLFPRMKYGVAGPEVLVSLKGVPLGSPAVSPDGYLSISALMSLADVVGSDVVRENAPLLVQAAFAVGSNQIRHMGTLGGNLCLENRCVYYNQSHQYQFVEPCFKRNGNLCHLAPKGKKCWAVSAADTVPALMSLNAQVVIEGPGNNRFLPLDALFAGDSLRPLTLGPAEVVTEVRIPLSPGGRRAAFVKFSQRGGLEFALVNVAVVMDLAEDRKTCLDVRITVSGVSSGPIRARKAEATLVGQKVSPDIFRSVAETTANEIVPLPRYEFSRPYLRKCVEVQSRDALTLAIDGPISNRGPHAD